MEGTEEQAGATGDETTAPEKGGKNGKAAKAGKANGKGNQPEPNADDDPVQPPAGPSEDELFAALGAAERKIGEAKAAVAAAETERDEALKALGVHLVPASAKRGEKITVGVGKGEARRYFVITVGRDRQLEIRPRA